MNIVLAFVLGALFAVSALYADVAIDGRAAWIGGDLVFTPPEEDR